MLWTGGATDRLWQKANNAAAARRLASHTPEPCTSASGSRKRDIMSAGTWSPSLPSPRGAPRRARPSEQRQETAMQSGLAGSAPRAWGQSTKHRAVPPSLCHPHPHSQPGCWGSSQCCGPTPRGLTPTRSGHQAKHSWTWRDGRGVPKTNGSNMWPSMPQCQYGSTHQGPARQHQGPAGETSCQQARGPRPCRQRGGHLGGSGHLWIVTRKCAPAESSNGGEAGQGSLATTWRGWSGTRLCPPAPLAGKTKVTVTECVRKKRKCWPFQTSTHGNLGNFHF